MMPKEIWVAIITATPALVGIVVSWVLQNRGFAQRVKQVEAFEKRVQVIERLFTLEKHLSNKHKSTGTGSGLFF